MKKLLFLLVIISLITVSNCFASIDCDGVDDSVTCGTTSVFEGDRYATFSIWVKPDSIETSQRIAGAWVTWIDTCPWLLTYANNDELTFGVTDDDLDRFCIRTTTSANVTAGDWQHYVATWTGEDNVIHIYVNGVDQNLTGNCWDVEYINGVGEHDRICSTTSNETEIEFNGVVAIACYWDAVLDQPDVTMLFKADMTDIPSQLKNANFYGCLLFDSVPNGVSADGKTFSFIGGKETRDCTGVDGSNNTGLTGSDKTPLTYP